MDTDSTSGSKGQARPSSSPSDGLFCSLYARGGATAETSDFAWLQAMLDVEAALARACAREGLIPAEAAEAIAGTCFAQRFDVGAIGREAASSATPVIALVDALRAAVPEDAAQYVHQGATSQDIVDTAMMLVAQRSLGAVLEDAAAAAEGAARLALEFRDTPMMGRTLLQQALPTTFGLRAAGWLVGIDEAAGVVRAAREQLAVQMGGPVGTRDPVVAGAVARELGLAEPVLPWHTIRVRVVTLAGALGTLAGVIGKVGRDVTLLAQNEVGEVREGGGPERGGSSSMAHKRNPVGAVSLLACSSRVPGLVGTMFGLMEHEHERAAGSWQAEWGTLTDLLRLTGSAVCWGRRLLEELEVDPVRMRENLGGVEVEVGAAGVLVDRALEAHSAR